MKLLKGKRLKSVLAAGISRSEMAGALSSSQVNISSACSKSAQEGGSLGSVIACVSAVGGTEDCSTCLWLANQVLQ